MFRDWRCIDFSSSVRSGVFPAPRMPLLTELESLATAEA